MIISSIRKYVPDLLLSGIFSKLLHNLKIWKWYGRTNAIIEALNTFQFIFPGCKSQFSLYTFYQLFIAFRLIGYWERPIKILALIYYRKMNSDLLISLSSLLHQDIDKRQPVVKILSVLRKFYLKIIFPDFIFYFSFVICLL